MNIPNERTHALREAKRFLHDLLEPSITPKVPRVIRRRAAWVLRHYLTDFDIERLVTRLPDLFGPP